MSLPDTYLKLWYHSVLALAVVVLAWLPGCETIPVEFCYVHPVYGQVCVQVGGKKHYREDLTPAQRAEVEKWVAEKDKK